MEIRTDEAEGHAQHIAEQASYWYARLREPDCTEADHSRFAEWRDDSPRHRAAFDRLQAIVAGLRGALSREDAQQFWQGAVRKADRRRRVLVLAKAAGVAVLAVVATTWVLLPENGEYGWQSARESVAGFWAGGASSYRTARGERSTVKLPDGSSVELNARSEIKVTFSEKRRHVELIGGQALFHVAKNPQRPFTVSAGDREIVAIGTAFDVRLDERSVRVTLIEGKVSVHIEENARSARTSGSATRPVAESPESNSANRSGSQPAPGGLAVSTDREESRDILLSPGQQLLAPLLNHQTGSGDGALALDERSGGGNAVRAVDVHRVTAWTEGRVFFEDHTLRDAVAEINRHNRVQIRVDDPVLAELRINGMFRAGELKSFVAALQEYFRIVARNDGKEIILEPAR